MYVHVYPRVKLDIKTFQEKVQHKIVARPTLAQVTFFHETKVLRNIQVSKGIRKQLGKFFFTM